MGTLALLEHRDVDPAGIPEAMTKFTEAEKKVKACFETYTVGLHAHVVCLNI